MIFVRGTYFRICADVTLRGPDNAVTANYSDGLWQVARMQHRILECRETVYLRVTSSDGRRKSIGPYECVRVAGGEIFRMTSILAHILEKAHVFPEWTSGARLLSCLTFEARFRLGTPKTQGRGG